MPTILRPGRPADAVPCGTICYIAFKTISERHGFPPDFPTPEPAIGLLTELLARADIYSVVAEEDGDIQGSNFLWETDEIVGVGPITVDPAAQNGSIGRRLMEDVLHRARERNAARVRLVQAAYHGRSLALYTKLGFNPLAPLTCLQGPALGHVEPGCEVRPATADDLSACAALHHAVHGHDRAGDLRGAMAQDRARLVTRNGRIAGYTTGIGFFGHAVGETNSDLQALIGAAESFPGPGLLLPTLNSELLRWCLGRGLRIVQPMTLMGLGAYQKPTGAWLPSIIY